MAAASDEQEVLKARLLAKEASLRDLTKRYLQFVNGVEGKSAEECGVLYQGLLKEIARYEFAVSKARSLIETNTRQVTDYDQMRQVIEGDMGSTQTDIERLAGQLQEERKVRQQKEQYAALARQINQYPPREETQTEIQALSAELVPPACPLKDVSLKAEGEAAATKLELRSKRFAGFTHALHDLQPRPAEKKIVQLQLSEDADGATDMATDM